MRIKQSRKLISGLLCMVIVLQGCVQKEEEPILAEPVKVEMNSAVVERTDISDNILFHAYMTPNFKKVSFPISGQIEELKVKIGDRVEEGQVLATLQKERLEEAIEAEKSEIGYTQRSAEISEQLTNTEIDICRQSIVNRNHELEELEKEYLTLDQYEKATGKSEEVSEMEIAQIEKEETDGSREAELEKKLKIAEAKLEQIRRKDEETIKMAQGSHTSTQEVEMVMELLKENIRDANHRIEILNHEKESNAEMNTFEGTEKMASLQELEQAKEDATLRAPVSGVITGAFGNMGEVLQNRSMIHGKEMVFCIAEEGDLYVVGAELEEKDLEDAEKVVCEVDGKEYELVRAPYTYEEEKYAIVNEEVLAPRFSFKGETPELEAGEHILLIAVKNRHKNVLSVPSKAIFNDFKSKTKYVIRIEGNRQEQVEVVLGATTKERTEILEGVSEGTEVLVLGSKEEETRNQKGMTKEKDFGKDLEFSKVRSWYPTIANIYWEQDGARVEWVENSKKVKKGDVIANLSPYSNQSALTRTQFLISSLEAENAKSLLSLNKEISRKEHAINLAETEGEKTLAEYEKAYAVLIKDQSVMDYEHRIKKAKKTLEQEKEQNSITTIIAPISGTVTDMAYFGEYRNFIEQGELFCIIEDRSLRYLMVLDENKLFYNMKVEICGTIDDLPVKIPGKVVSASNVLTVGAYDNLTGSIIVGLDGKINPKLKEIEVRFYRGGE